MPRASVSQLRDITSATEIATTKDRRILIVDEARFSRICAAILELEGHRAVTISGEACRFPVLNSQDFGLIITSYPFGAFLFDELKKAAIPLILLTDYLGRDVMRLLGQFEHLQCMIKPVDYQELRIAVRRIMHGDSR